jgi:hypothetical protein
MNDQHKETQKEIADILKKYFEWHIERTEKIDKRIEWTLWVYGYIMIAVLICLVCIAFAVN